MILGKHTCHMGMRTPRPARNKAVAHSLVF